MKKNKKKLILLLTIVAAGIGMACAGTLAYLWFGPLFRPTDTAYLYIDRDDTIDSIYYKVEKAGNPKIFIGFRWMVAYREYDRHIRTGRYAIRPGENVYHVLSRLRWGYQEPMNLVVGSVRQLLISPAS